MKELKRVIKSHCHHPCLIAIISRSPVTILKLFCKSQLDYLFPITENSKFGFTCEHFTTSYYAQIPAEISHTEVSENTLFIIPLSFYLILLFHAVDFFGQIFF